MLKDTFSWNSWKFSLVKSALNNYFAGASRQVVVIIFDGCTPSMYLFNTVFYSNNPNVYKD